MRLRGSGRFADAVVVVPLPELRADSHDAVATIGEQCSGSGDIITRPGLPQLRHNR
jgi:hypothetical protein